MSLKNNFIRMTLVFALLFVAAANMQAQTIKVNVKDATGEGIIGATVQEKGTSNGKECQQPDCHLLSRYEVADGES